jgi:EpsI family protein
MSDVVRFAPTALLAVGCILISGIREQQKVKSREPIPSLQLELPGLTHRDTTISDEERRVAAMSDYVLRFYQRDTTIAASVYVGYYDYQVQGKAIHSPKNCLPGAGWEQLNASVQPVPVGGVTYPVNRYLLANKQSQALVYYWYQGRGRVEASEYKVKYNLMRDAALYGRTEEALVRIVVPIDPVRLTRNETQSAYASADSLAMSIGTRLIPAVTTLMPLPPGT